MTHCPSALWIVVMPDWLYRTVGQRVLFSLPNNIGRHLALGVIGTLGKSAAGRAIIDFLGHMAPDPSLATTVAGVPFRSPFGLGWRVDPGRLATAGLAQFGVGFIEQTDAASPDVRRGGRGELVDYLPWCERRPRGSPLPCVLLLRRFEADGAESVELPSGVVLPVVACDDSTDTSETCGQGVVLQVGRRQAPGQWTVPAAPPPDWVKQVRAWRERLPAEAVLIVSGGVAQPEDAVELMHAGADLVMIDAGLVYHGPGLVKRCNEAWRRERGQASAAKVPATSLRDAWIWALGLGLALAVGGVATMFLAFTRVLLPYDEHYLGFTWDTLRRNQPLLFAFMAHDRGTLAGAMLALGWFYGMVAWFGIRRGIHGTRTSVIASALVGFASFFAFFGFGYFDALHAFVAVVLFQLTVQIMVGGESAARVAPVVDTEDAAWRRAQWGQLLWIIHAVGLLGAGGVILWIGMTDVFVQEDLSFLCLTPSQLRDLGDRLVAVVAHDRATLGGMLLAAGVGTLLSVLWYFRRGESWLWHAMLGLGVLAYIPAIGVHFLVGYNDWRHLVPAFGGAVLWSSGVLLTRGYLRT